jgi:hypothetical protein
MKVIRVLGVLAAISVLAGFGWDILVWRLHFPYLPFHWLVHSLHADGESAYTAMMYEMMIFFFVLSLLLWLLFHFCCRNRPGKNSP